MVPPCAGTMVMVWRAIRSGRLVVGLRWAWRRMVRSTIAGFEQGEGGAEAASGSAAEGDPGVGAGAGVEEALGAEGEWVGVEVGAAVEECDVRDGERAGRDA